MWVLETENAGSEAAGMGIHIPRLAPRLTVGEPTNNIR